MLDKLAVIFCGSGKLLTVVEEGQKPLAYVLEVASLHFFASYSLDSCTS